MLLVREQHLEEEQTFRSTHLALHESVYHREKEELLSEHKDEVQPIGKDVELLSGEYPL